MNFLSIPSEIIQATPPPGCPDLDKNEICISQCASALDECKNFCTPADYSCPSRCDAAFLECEVSCPCGSECPQGCAGCSNPICSASEYLLILNTYAAEDNKGFLIDLATDAISFANIDYNSDFFEIDDSCYAFVKGEHWLLGGYYVERQIIKFEPDNCKLTLQQSYLRIGHIDGMYGSCAVYNDVAHLCFDEGGVDAYSCQTFDGENQDYIGARTTYPHDWASMAVYDDKMWVVGGCDPSGFSCGSTVEFYDGESWQIAPNHPHESIYGNLVLGDATGLYECVSNRTV